MIRSLLYASDLGVYAPFVLQHALALARTFNADLYIIHAVEPMGQFAESLLQSYLDPRALDQLHSQGVNAVLANIEQQVLANIREDLDDAPELLLIKAIRVRQGDPAQVILEQAQRLQSDLLIFGSHSQGAGVDVPIGRTAARLLQLAPMPVYMVPLSQQLGRRKL